jgi:hypothetical protein
VAAEEENGVSLTTEEVVMAAETMAPAQAPDGFERSLAQRMDALQEANRVRTYRAGLKDELKAGEKQLVDMLLDPPAEVETMKVFDLMLAAPKIGRVKANKVLQRARVSPSKTIGGLSPRQRAQLVAVLGGRR